MEALRYHRYRLVLTATTLTGVAVWIWQISLISGMLEAGRPSVDIGLFSAASAIAAPLAVILGGLLTDRLGPTRVVRGGLASLVIGYLVMAVAVSQGGADSLLVLLAMALFIGWTENFYGVGLTVLAAGVVPAAAMPSAIGLLLIPVAGGRILSGLIAGPLVTTLGTPIALAASGALACGALLTVVAIGRARTTHRTPTSMVSDMRLGLRWFRGNSVAVSVVVIGGVAALLVYGALVLVPIVAGDTLGKDAGTQGLVATLGGVGVALGAMSFGRLRRGLGLGPLVLLTASAASLGLMILGGWHTSATVLVLVVAIPFSTNIFGVATSLILQSLAEPGIRGRVLGINSLVSSVLLPVGAVLGGALSGSIGVEETLLLMGGLTLVVLAVSVIVRPSLARVRGSTLSPVTVALPGPEEHGSPALEFVFERELDAADRRRRLRRLRRPRLRRPRLSLKGRRRGGRTRPPT